MTSMITIMPTITTTATIMAESLPPLEVLFQDHHLIAVYKPARIPVGSEDSGDVTLLQMVRAWNAARQVEDKKGYCVPIHFLDRPVSGVILFALSSKAASRLNQMFREHKLSKVYWAVSETRPREAEGVLEHWLSKNRDTNVTKVVPKNTSDAKYCKLSYRVLKDLGQGHTLLEVKPVTGRSHQIRVQLSAIGCPLYGDRKYGAASSWDGRIGLHAAKLEIHHPVSKELLHLRAEPPQYWHDVWSHLPQMDD